MFDFRIKVAANTELSHLRECCFADKICVVAAYGQAQKNNPREDPRHYLVDSFGMINLLSDGVQTHRYIIVN